MSTPNNEIAEIAVATLQGYSKKIADNISNHNALLRQVFLKGNIEEATGRSIIQEIDFGNNETGKWYSGSDILNIGESEVLTAAEFSYKEYNVNVVMTGLDQVQNSGKEAIHSFLKARISNAERTAKNDIARALYSDGTGNNGKEIGGIGLIVSDVPDAGIVGGIDRSLSSNGFWRNKMLSALTDKPAGDTSLSKNNIQAMMNKMWLSLTRGVDHPDVILANEKFYSYYEDSLQTIKRIASDSEANAGFESLKYKTANVYYDDQCPQDKMYMLNTDFLFFRPAKNKNFVQGKPKEATNQDITIIPLYWKGNLTCSNCALQGVILP